MYIPSTNNELTGLPNIPFVNKRIINAELPMTKNDIAITTIRPPTTRAESIH